MTTAKELVGRFVIGENRIASRTVMLDTGDQKL